MKNVSDKKSTTVKTKFKNNLNDFNKPEYTNRQNISPNYRKNLNIHGSDLKKTGFTNKYKDKERSSTPTNGELTNKQYTQSLNNHNNNNSISGSNSDKFKQISSAQNYKPTQHQNPKLINNINYNGIVLIPFLWFLKNLFIIIVFNFRKKSKYNFKKDKD